MLPESDTSNLRRHPRGTLETMRNPIFGKLDPLPALEHPELLAPSTFAAVQQYVPDALVAQIDPALSDTEVMCENYDVPLGASANIVLITGKRNGEARKVACQVLADQRLDINHFVRQTLGVRKCSFASMDDAVASSGMPYGAITPVGLPDDWPLWVDGAVADTEWICIGAGVREAKLFLPGADLLKLPTAIRQDGMAQSASA